MRPAVRPARAALAVPAALLLAACAGGPGGHDAARPALTPPPIGASPAPPASGRAGMTGLPLAAYSADDRQGARHFQAVQILTMRCLREGGFTSVARQTVFGDPAAEPPDDDAGAYPAGPFGYLGAEVAAAQGFHSRPRPAPAAGGPEQHGTEAERAAAEECSKKSVQQLGVPATAGTRLLGELYDASMRAAAADARVAAATAAWRACMGRAGFPVTDPQALVTRYQAVPPGGPDELPTARADAECTAGSNLAGIYFAVLTGYQRQQVEQHGAELESVKQSVRAEARKVADVIAADGR
ncbi:hypothetical protein AB0D08_08085 [Kitasatospora sp. NPDC048540]|uniref:hypothetical protein n=1 Tax=unclassified Kitasatospora TaxID=2633591 RepID=UPI00053B7C9D|nr:hypothetical protein [Kitasatospora sp. MBT63]